MLLVLRRSLALALIASFGVERSLFELLSLCCLIYKMGAIIYQAQVLRRLSKITSWPVSGTHAFGSQEMMSDVCLPHPRIQPFPKNKGPTYFNMKNLSPNPEDSQPLKTPLKHLFVKPFSWHSSVVLPPPTVLKFCLTESAKAEEIWFPGVCFAPGRDMY